MAFKVQESSDALIEAMRMRVATKVYGEQAGTGIGGGNSSCAPGGAASTGVVRVAGTDFRSAAAATAAYGAADSARQQAGAFPSTSFTLATSADGQSRARPMHEYVPSFRPVEGAQMPAAASTPTGEAQPPIVDPILRHQIGHTFSTTAAPASVFAAAEAAASPSANGADANGGAPLPSPGGGYNVGGSPLVRSRPSTAGEGRALLQPRARAHPAHGMHPPLLPPSSGGGASSSRPPRPSGGPSGQAAAAAAAAAEAAARAANAPTGDVAEAVFAASAAAVAAAQDAVGERNDSFQLQPLGHEPEQDAAHDDATGIEEGRSLYAPTASAGLAYGAGMYGGVLPKLPSAVCLGGVPVAADGDLVYLGGGLYAAASAPPNRETNPAQSAGKPRTMPGRVAKPPPRSHGPKFGRSSAVRSASAHLMGPHSARAPSESGSSPSRAQSDGQLSTGGGGRRAGKGADDVNSGPPAWRPSGVGRRPPTPDTRAPKSARDPGEMRPAFASEPGAFSEARLQARRDAHQEKKDAGLFGPSGLLAQLREGEAREARELIRRQVAEEQHSMMPMPVQLRSGGPPQNGAKREAERRAAKEAKVQMMLEEREARLAAAAAEAKEKRALVRHAAAAASAPALTTANLLGVTGDLEGQKKRVQTKMEILEMLNGYTSLSGKAKAEQTKALIAKLQHDIDGGLIRRSDAASDAGQSEEHFDGGWRPDDEADHMDEAMRQPFDYDSDAGPLTVQERLQQMNDSCNRAFEEMHEV